ncbi:MAG: phosphotransferase [Bacteroidales bacterium]|nr:phosphotransferase [Bacteroidales bacterium]
MSEKELLAIKYREYTGEDCIDIISLPRSGSDRKYFRLTGSGKNIIGAYNPNREENDAFIGFTNHFRSLHLPVPEIYIYFPGADCYFIQDLGDTNLYTWLERKKQTDGFDEELLDFYRQSLEMLVLFQTEAIRGLDLDLCYPHKSFDRQSMIWDLNYFKYMFLKLVAAPFNEKHLEKDFNTLVDFLLEAGQDYFLYRDFQSANIMVLDKKPWFIDYQGGRRGSAQYDPASLLYDPKAHVPQEAREILIEHYIKEFCKMTSTGESYFRKYYHGFVMIRIMQALGAFAYRGLYEKKPGFVQSIIPGVRILNNIIESGQLNISLPELFRILKEIPGLERFAELEQPERLKVSLTSFSYMNGIPHDKVHGGGFVYDCRGLPNPSKNDKLRNLTGLDEPVKKFMESHDDVKEFLSDASRMVKRTLQSYIKKNYTSLAVSFGCTGGKHRSVYCAQEMMKCLKEIDGIEIEIKHRDKDT